MLFRSPGAGSLVRGYRSWTTLYVGCNDGVRRSTDGGNRWTQLPGSPAAGGADNRLSSTRNGVIVSHRYFNDLQLYRNGAFTTVRVPNAPGVAQAVFDGGTTNPTRIMAVTYAPSATGQTGAIGALVSDDAGSTWRQVNGGLGMLRFFSVNADPHHAGVFIAGTYGGGFYRINLNAPLTGAIVQPDPKAPQGRVPDVVDQRPGNRGRRPELPPQARVPELPRQAQAPGN